MTARWVGVLLVLTCAEVVNDGPTPAPAPPDPPACIGVALYLDGSSHVAIPRLVEDDLTLEAWIKTGASLTGTNFYQGRGLFDADVIGGPPVNDFAATILNGRFAFGSGNPDVTVQGASNVANDEWAHVAVAREAASGQVRIVVNGVLESSVIVDNRGPLTASPSIALGGGSVVRNFIGLVDEVRIWSVARTPRQIADHLRDRPDPSEPGLVVYLGFEDPDATPGVFAPGADGGAMLVAPAYVPSTALCPLGDPPAP